LRHHVSLIATNRNSLGYLSWNLILEYTQRTVEKIQVPRNLTNISDILNAHLLYRNINSGLLKGRNISYKLCTKNYESHSLFNFSKKNWRICSNVNMLQKETSHWSKYNTAHAHCMPDKKGYKTHNQNIEQKFILNSNNGKAKEPQLFVSNQIVYSS